MIKPNNIAQLLEANQFDLKNMARMSAIWFEKQAFNLMDAESMSPKAALRGDPNALKVSIRPGSLYFYIYDAKHKATLPYFDQFPLVLPFSAHKDGFTGLNLHYLPYEFRIKLLSRLQEFNTSTKLTSNTRMMFQWETIKGVAKYKQAQPCVKRYLFNHVRSPFRIVSPPDWATACMLPMERFEGSDKFKVWADSLRT